MSHTRPPLLALVALSIVALAALVVWAAHRPPSRAGAAGQVAYSFLAWGDIRPGSQAVHAAYRPAWDHVRDKMAAEPHAFEVAVGDFVNIAATDSATDADAKYADFFTALGKLRSVPRAYAIGNHEAVGTTAVGAAAWEKNIRPAHYDVFTYGAGTIAQPRVVVLDLSTHEAGHLGVIGYAGEGSGDNSPQADWLVGKLRTYAGDANTFLVVNLHHPIADPKPSEGYDTHTAEREAIEALFRKYGVDLVLQGHVHAYVRHVMPDGTTYLLQGMGGAEAKDEAYAAHTTPGTDASRIGSVDSSQEQFGFTKFDVTTAGVLQATTYVAGETDWVWRVGDSFKVTQQKPETASPSPSPSATPSGTPSPSATLLSLGKPSRASSNRRAAGHGNDGLGTTRWTASSRRFPQWWRVDLGRVRSVGRVKVRFYDPAGSPRTYAWRLQRSDDGRTWTRWTAGDTARYVRVYVKGLKAGHGRASIVEVRVFAPGG